MMSVPDAGLPFFGVQAGARGERVSIEEKAVRLTLVGPTNLTGRAAGVDDVVQVAAALAILLYRYTYEPTVVIGIADQELRTEEAHGLGIVPMSVPVDAQHTLEQVISRISKAAGEARAEGTRSRSVAAPDRSTPVVVTVRPQAHAGFAAGADQGRSHRYARMLRTTDLVIEIDKE